MKILVACEFSGVVRDAFIAKGHDAVSCDIIPSEKQGPHYLGDVQDILYEYWDLILAFPPCTHLCGSGARWWKEKRADGRQQAAIDFFLLFTEKNEKLHCPYVLIENPVGIMSRIYRKPDQIVQPWQFGHGETKATCFWLRRLPTLQPTHIVAGRIPRIHHMSPSENRSMERGRTYTGIAQAMVDQYGMIQ